MYKDYEILNREIMISRVFFNLAIKGELKDISAVPNIIDIIEKLDNKENLEGKEFRKIGTFLYESNEAYKFYSEIDDLLTEKIIKYFPLKELIDNIFRIFTENGEIKDDATIELKNIRKNIASTKNQINSEFNKIKNRYYKYLSIDQPIERNNRVCIAVKSENRNLIRGITVGKSDSGATVFVEPENIIELNDALINIESEEKVEIIKILSNLTFDIQKTLEKLKNNIEIISYIDANIAKSKYAKKKNAIFVTPKKDNKNIDLKELKHPLIAQDKVVPINVELKKNGMIITGPNTGGKTVSLKSIGVAFFMAHACLPVLALKADLPFIDEIYTDIGDQQNISENLSTFSAHLVNIKHIVENVTSNSLVLIDELGTGTDPIEGSALSKAILGHLLDIGPILFVTSHLSEIKAFSLEEDRLTSASMSFDLETLKPTYKLIIGVPGASHAIEIAEKLGIERKIIENAKRNLNKEHAENENILKRLSYLYKEYEENREKQKNQLQELDRLKKEYGEKLEKLRKKEIESLDKEFFMIKKQIKEIKNEIQRIIEDVKIALKEKDLERLKNNLKDADNLSNQMKELEDSLFKKRSLSKKSNVKLKIGMKVKVPGNMQGIIKEIDESKATVQIKNSPIEITYQLNDIEPVGEEKDIEELKNNVNVKISKKKAVYPEIDVRGYTVNEAIPVIEKFISDLIASGIKEGRIIHGKGTGKLAIGIWEYLRNFPLVKDFKIARTEEGGTGATIIEV